MRFISERYNDLQNQIKQIEKAIASIGIDIAMAAAAGTEYKGELMHERTGKVKELRKLEKERNEIEERAKAEYIANADIETAEKDAVEIIANTSVNDFIQDPRMEYQWEWLAIERVRMQRTEIPTYLPHNAKELESYYQRKYFDYLFGLIEWQIDAIDNIRSEYDSPAIAKALEENVKKNTGIMRSLFEERITIAKSAVDDIRARLIKKGISGIDAADLTCEYMPINLQLFAGAPTISSERISNRLVLMDKINTSLFTLTDNEWLDTIRADVGIETCTSKQGTDTNAVRYAIDLSKLDDCVKLSAKLTAEDQDIFNVVLSFIHANRYQMTASQICREVYGESKPNKRQLDSVMDSLNKMGGMRIIIDLSKDCGLPNGTKTLYNDSMIDWKSITVTQRGKTMTAIAIKEKPPLMTYAEIKKQFTVVPARLYQTPLIKGKYTTPLVNYLILHIVRNEKHGTVYMSAKSIADKIHIDRTTDSGKRQFLRMNDQIKELLSFFKTEGFISAFAVDGDKITIKPNGKSIGCKS